MNLNQYKTTEASDAGAEMVVYDPKGNPTDATITLAGRDSQIYRKREQELNAILRRTPSSQVKNFDFKAFTDETYKLCVLSWRGICVGDSEMECTKENISKLLDDPDARFIFDQIREFVDDRANFMQSNVKN